MSCLHFTTRKPKRNHHLEYLSFDQSDLEIWFEARGLLDWAHFAHRIYKHGIAQHPDLEASASRLRGFRRRRNATSRGYSHDTREVDDAASESGMPVYSVGAGNVPHESVYDLPTECVRHFGPRIHMDAVNQRRLKCLLELIDADPRSFAGLRRSDRDLLREYWGWKTVPFALKKHVLWKQINALDVEEDRQRMRVHRWQEERLIAGFKAYKKAQRRARKEARVKAQSEKEEDEKKVETLREKQRVYSARAVKKGTESAEKKAKEAEVWHRKFSLKPRESTSKFDSPAWMNIAMFAKHSKDSVVAIYDAVSVATQEDTEDELATRLARM